MFDYDAELRFYRGRFRGACGVRAGERVLDVGCGGGQTTRDAGADAAPGAVLGVDTSERMLDLARRSTSQENVSYLLADAATYDFGTAYDVCISRFGVMFFADPVGAFRNLRRACRRLTVMVWQPRSENEWAQAIPAALGSARGEADGEADGEVGRDESAFSLGDSDVAREVLSAAGFTAVTFTAVREPVYYGPDVPTAYENVLQLHEPMALLANLEPPAAEQAREALRATLAAHETADGVLFESAVWIIQAE